MHELQRLEVEGTLRPKGNGLTAEHGTLTITNITLPLKREYVRALAAGTFFIPLFILKTRYIFFFSWW